jgi:hypothetical protein
MSWENDRSTKRPWTRRGGEDQGTLLEWMVEDRDPRSKCQQGMGALGDGARQQGWEDRGGVHQ